MGNQKELGGQQFSGITILRGKIFLGVKFMGGQLLFENDILGQNFCGFKDFVGPTILEGQIFCGSNIATLGPSWSFSSAENLQVSACKMGYEVVILLDRTVQPPTHHPPDHIDYQNIKSGISQQPLVGSFSNFKFKLRGPNQNHKGVKGRQLPMEEELKMLKAEFLSNH